MDDLPKVQLRQAISTEPKTTIKKETPVKKIDKKSDKKAAKAVKEDKAVKVKVGKGDKKSAKVEAKADKKNKGAKKEDKKATKAVKSSVTSLSAAVVTPVAAVKLDLAVPSTVQDNLLITAVRAFNAAHSVKTIKESINVGATYARQINKTITNDVLAGVRNEVAATFDKKVASAINKAVGLSAKGKLDKDGYSAAQNAIIDLFPVKKVKGKK